MRLQDEFESLIPLDSWASLIARSITSSLYDQRKDFPGLTFGDDLEGPTTDLAIRGEPLKLHGRVQHQLARLTAVRTLDGLGNLHGQK